MCNRAWGLHVLLSIFRCLEIIFSTGNWFGDHEKCSADLTQNCIGTYDENLMEPTRPTCLFVLELLIFLGVFADALCYKWRQLARFFIYLELLCRLMAVMIPNTYGYS